MCGIAGYIDDHAPRLAQFDRAMMEAVGYRGRDARTRWSDEKNVTFLHARLSIIDLEAGGQPMIDRTGRFVLIFNGAIYNFLELRAEYEAAGAIFQTASDTEVILQGFALKGERVVYDLNGMFAFAIWDRIEKRLFLARDRLGKKPLFWSTFGGAFLFASSIDAFRAIPGWNAELSKAGLLLYSVLGGFPGNTTAFAQAFALPPANFAWIELGQVHPSVRRYWLPNYEVKSRGRIDDFIDEYEELLTDAIRMRLRSDVPVALSFSGGVDSGTIAALAKMKLNSNLSCYTIDYDSPDQPSDEVATAREVARRLDLEWTHIQFDYRRELIEGLPGAYRNFDQPCQQFALVYSRRLYEVMKSRCTVALGGVGADEIFTGYVGDEAIVAFDKSRGWLRRVPDSIYGRLPAKWREAWDYPRLSQLKFPEWSRIDMRSWISGLADGEVPARCIDAIDMLAHEYAEAGIDTMADFVMHRALVVSATDANYRLPDITGYAAQVEVRSPFLDHRMIEFAARLPHHLKVGKLGSKPTPKFLPRLLYERFVGPEIAWGQKRGMGANLQWGLEWNCNSKFQNAMSEAFRSLDRHDIRAEPFERARQQFLADVKAKTPRTTAGRMMNGFMLGSWLQIRAENSLQPIT